MNRLLVFFDGHGFIPVNQRSDIKNFGQRPPERIGDKSEIWVGKDVPTKAHDVTLLASSNMAKNSNYLVDLDNMEAWPYG